MGILKMLFGEPDDPARSAARSLQATREVMQEAALTEQAVRAAQESARAKALRQAEQAAKVFDAFRLPAGVLAPAEVSESFRNDLGSPSEEAHRLVDHYPSSIRSGPAATLFWLALSHRCALHNYREARWQALQSAVINYHASLSFSKYVFNGQPLPGYPEAPESLKGAIDGLELSLEVERIKQEFSRIGTSSYERRCFVHLAQLYLGAKGLSTPVRQDVLRRIDKADSYSGLMSHMWPQYSFSGDYQGRGRLNF